MNHAKLIASAGALLLATSALTPAATAQVVLNSKAAQTTSTQGSSYFGGNAVYQSGGYAPNYAKADPYAGYVYSADPMASMAAPIPYPMPTTSYAAPVTPQYDYLSAPGYVDAGVGLGAGPVVQTGAVAVAGTINPYAAVQPQAGYGGAGVTVIDASSSASASAAALGTVPQYVDHTHSFKDHDHQPVEHSHGYQEHQHTPEFPGAHYGDGGHDETGKNVVFAEIVVAKDPSKGGYHHDPLSPPDHGYDDSLEIIDATPQFGSPTKDNALRLSAGYGYATAGNLNYGIQGNYTSDSSDYADWTTHGSESFNEGTYWIDEELQHKGIYGSLKGDIGNFFVDVVGGIYTVEDQVITQRYNLAEAYEDVSGGSQIGPAAPIIDGSPAGRYTGLFVYTAPEGIEGDEFDSLDVTATINSEINDYGAAAGYSLNLPGVPVKFGVGIAGKSLNRLTTIDVTSTVNEVTTGELFSAAFDDHTYTEEISGTYVGPALRVNFDPSISSTIGAHFGGSVQALYGTSDMLITQGTDALTYTVEDSNTGFMFAGELDAGLSMALSPNIQIGAGVFAGMTSGAPIVTNANTITDALDSDPVVTLGQGNWQNYGLKGSITARF